MPTLTRPLPQQIQLSVVGATLLLACSAPAPSEAPNASAQAIVGGEIDTATRGVVSINIDATGHYFAADCTGTLIAPNLVLTARHCVSFTADSSNAPVSCTQTRFVRTRAPETILISPNAEAPRKGDPSLYSVTRIFVPDEGTSICGFDLALLELATKVPASQATPLTPRLTAAARKAERFSALGFGLTADGGSGQRMRSDANIVTCAPGACSKLDSQIADSEWLSEAAPLCHGDSGGPALDSDNQVIGVASRGAADCSSVVYAAVNVWSELISNAGLQAATAGGYAPPDWVLEPPDASIVDAAAMRDAGAQIEPDASTVATSKESEGCTIPSRAPASTFYERLLLLVLGSSWALRRLKRRSTQ